MALSDTVPERSGYGDVFSMFVLILSVAIGLQAYTGFTEYAELRAHGVITQGHLADRYTDPYDGNYYVIYYFVAGYETYRNKQQAPEDEIPYTGGGDTVSIVYLPDNPNLSRVTGTEAYRKTHVFILTVSTILAAFSLQYLVAYYTERSAWIFKMIATLRRRKTDKSLGNQQDRPGLSQEEIQSKVHEQAMRKRRKRRYIKWGIIAGVSIAIVLALSVLIDSIQNARLRAKYENRAERIAIEATVQVFNGVEMVLVPAGCFDMGNDSAGGQQCFDEPFWIDRYEVTNEQYGSTGCIDPLSQPNQPRNCVDWGDAYDFCESRGARLPTEAEWEYAARGPDNLIYPWGNDFVADNVVYLDNSDGQTAAVGSRSGGVSWAGAYDMSGNVWEWTSTLYRDYPYDADDGRELYTIDSSLRVLRGGSFDNTEGFLRAALRSKGSPGYIDDIKGFRCARSYSNP